MVVATKFSMSSGAADIYLTGEACPKRGFLAATAVPEREASPLQPIVVLVFVEKARMPPPLRKRAHTFDLTAELATFILRLEGMMFAGNLVQ